MNRKLWSVVAATLMAAGVAGAQGDGPNPGGRRPGGVPPGGDPKESFFPPELVMQNQKALGLTDDQSKSIREEMQNKEARFGVLQWQQSAEAETLKGLLQSDKVDKKQVQAQLDKLLAIESEVQRLRFGMMVRIKNILTPDQQAQLRELKKQMRPPMSPRDGGAGKPGDAGQGRPQPPPTE